MYVCLCCAVTDYQLRDAVVDGALDVAEIGRRTGAGTDCGQCRDVLRAFLANVPGSTGAQEPVVDERSENFQGGR